MVSQHPPYEPTRDLGEILAWADQGTTPVKIRARIARVQRWLRITHDASADAIVARMRIMLPAFALAVVEQLDRDERDEMLAAVAGPLSGMLDDAPRADAGPASPTEYGPLSVDEALASFGMEATPEFRSRYQTDPYVYHLTNALRMALGRLRDDATRAERDRHG